MKPVRTEHEYRLRRHPRAFGFGERLRDNGLELVAAEPDENDERHEFQIEIERVHFSAPEVGECVSA
jgi:hypothetical protein